MDVITTHLNADFDALASCAAAQKLYPDSAIVLPGSMERRVREFVEVFRPVAIGKFRDLPVDRVRRLIIVDTKQPDRIGPLKQLIDRPSIKIHIYDHHPPGKNDIRGEVEVLQRVGAVSTLFAEILQRKKIRITPMEATLLCLGIYEETGSLLFASTTPKDLMAAAYLLKRGANLRIVSDFIKSEMSKEEIVLLNDLISSLREIVVHGIKVKIGRGAMEGFDDVAHLAHTIMNLEEMDAVFLLIGMADKILIVARSKAPELDVARVMAEFGGGGHQTAASATIKDMPFELVEERVVQALQRHTRPMKVAIDVMTTPVKVISWDSTIKEAEDVMTRYGVTVLPVVKEERYMGIIAREVVEKALFHSFGRSRCLDFATIDAAAAASDTPVAEVEGIMVEQNQRFVPVLEGERIVGAITRTDILRTLYEDVLRKSRIDAADDGGRYAYRGLERNLSKVIAEQLPQAVVDFLRLGGDVADSMGCGVYLVGGCVRDLLRREQNLDIDIVVEGDGIEFARKLAERIDAKVTAHQRFRTAQVLVKQDAGLRPQGLKIDIATARTEYYESPATLPKVETSSIKKDLYRRDFTINTLAVKLNQKDFGRLIDFFGGQRDLKDRQIRVLHNLSFVEDPTRAFRAIRFSERFGFKLTKHTENLIKLALRMNVFERLSGTRIYEELLLIFRETNPIKAIRRLGDFDLLGVIHPRLCFTSELESLFQSTHDTATWFDLLFFDEPYERGHLYIMALLDCLDESERIGAVTRLGMAPQIREKILRDLLAGHDILRKMRSYAPVEVYHLLTGLDLEATLFAMALTQNSEKKKAISQFLLELRDVNPLLKGDDLKRIGIPPGPLYTKLFRAILDEKLLGKLGTKDDEIAFAKGFVAEQRIST